MAETTVRMLVRRLRRAAAPAGGAAASDCQLLERFVAHRDEQVARERFCADDVPAAVVADDVSWRNLRRVLDEEVSRLPVRRR
jgi:hypothetical protein